MKMAIMGCQSWWRWTLDEMAGTSALQLAFARHRNPTRFFRMFGEHRPEATRLTMSMESTGLARGWSVINGCAIRTTTIPAVRDPQGHKCFLPLPRAQQPQPIRAWLAGPSSKSHFPRLPRSLQIWLCCNGSLPSLVIRASWLVSCAGSLFCKKPSLVG